MAQGYAVRLLQRALLSLKGKDASELLQGLTTNDLRSVAQDGALYTLLLNTQGRIEHDLMVYNGPQGLLVECSVERREALKRTLHMYRMHKQVHIESCDTPVFFVEQPCAGAVRDPRIPAFGHRLITDSLSDSSSLVEASVYEERRFKWGIVEGTDELRGALPIYRNADLMHGLSADKGCYLGQEVTARALRGSVRKRVLPFICDGPAQGSIIETVNNSNVGQVLACNGHAGLALLRLDKEQLWSNLKADSVSVQPSIPSWWPDLKQAMIANV